MMIIEEEFLLLRLTQLLVIRRNIEVLLVEIIHSIGHGFLYKFLECFAKHFWSKAIGNVENK
jgi:hypothetical protein